jgi:NAD(P)-dependent dehydrogenase (short-subunit alcohol dehydrogenase family)
MVAPTTPRDALVKNRLREFFNLSPGFTVARGGHRSRVPIASSVAVPCRVGQAINAARSSINLRDSHRYGYRHDAFRRRLHNQGEIMASSVVLITGALTGIGRATASAFARQGARLIVSGRHDDAGRMLLTELRGLGAEAEFIRADVRREEDVRALIDRAIERFGRLAVAVNNAGTEGQPGPLTEQSAGSYAATFDTNVLGTILSLKHELRVMIAQGGGSIVNLSSTMGSRGAAGASMYVASKHAVEGLTKSAALEGAPYGVRVNAVAPGPVETELLNRFAGSADRKTAMAQGVPLKRIGRPEEIADAIVFLASGGAGFLTGEIVHVNGGKTAL